jgi:pyroglutamyl-peptidase
MRRRSTILLTGFGPFPGVENNASALLATKLAHLVARRFPGHRVVARVLPTEWDAGPAYLARVYAREHPALALHFGVSQRAVGFVIETTARNLQNLEADGKGMKPSRTCVIDGGPETIACRVPAGEIVSRLTALGLAAVTSEDAGAYLCNAVYYRALALAADGGWETRIGFVHVPANLGDALACPISWQGALDGGLEIVRACLGRPPPARIKPR